MIAVLVGGNGAGKTRCLEQVSAGQDLIVADRLGQDLHPDNLAPFCDRLREQAERMPVIAATVSPYMVDCFAYVEVWVLHNGRAARLDQYPRGEFWSSELQAGEFWSSVGEAWVAESPHAITLTELVELLRNQTEAAGQLDGS